MSKRIAVIGIGNTLRRDDGIGIQVLGSLLKFYKRPGIDYLDFGAASFDLLNRMKDYDEMLIIDGIDAELAPGEMKIATLEKLSYSFPEGATSTHGFDLKTLFELYKTLAIKTKIFVAGIQVADISYGEGLSKAVENRREDIARQLDSYIEHMAQPIR